MKVPILLVSLNPSKRKICATLIGEFLCPYFVHWVHTLKVTMCNVLIIIILILFDYEIVLPFISKIKKIKRWKSVICAFICGSSFRYLCSALCVFQYLKIFVSCVFPEFIIYLVQLGIFNSNDFILTVNQIIYGFLLNLTGIFWGDTTLLFHSLCFNMIEKFFSFV